jgi:hypothetical protein
MRQRRTNACTLSYGVPVFTETGTSMDSGPDVEERSHRQVNLDVKALDRLKNVIGPNPCSAGSHSPTASKVFKKLLVVRAARNFPLITYGTLRTRTTGTAGRSCSGRTQPQQVGVCSVSRRVRGGAQGRWRCGGGKTVLATPVMELTACQDNSRGPQGVLMTQ